MAGLLWGVFVASLIGSLHCAGMCGPLVLFCGGGERPRGNALLAYHGARLVGYAALGLAAGALGAAIDLGGEQAGIGRMAAILAGVFMILAGLNALLGPRLARWRAGRASGADVALQPKRPGRLTRRLTAWMASARRLGSFQRSLWIGALTAFLPCGWLYAFAAAAAGTAAPWKGALVMASFWVGTLPILLGLGLGAGSLLGPLRRRAPALISSALVVLGLFTLLGRWSVPSFAEALGPDAGARALAGELTDEPLPCCGTAAVDGSPASAGQADDPLGRGATPDEDCACCASGGCEAAACCDAGDTAAGRDADSGPSDGAGDLHAVQPGSDASE